MKAIMITFDSLNRKMLPNYGNTEIIAPAFERLEDHCTRFENCYAGSLPCMPARRELHTGRENFLHTRWSALEPYDDSMPEILKNNGIHTHLTTDHVHYWEDEGFAYHNRYSTYFFSRGQEGDPICSKVDRKSILKIMEGRRVPHLRVQDAINREGINEIFQFPQSVTFENGLDFLECNHESDDWFLHIETFDPHEPFFAPDKFRKLYGLNSVSNQSIDWPDYKKMEDDFSEELLENYRKEYMALVSFCDYNLGRVLDVMDKYNLWKDTMLIVNTDHGFLIGEKGWLGKNTGPYYEEVAHIPLFIYNPKDIERKNSSKGIVQTVDIPATILSYYGLEIPKDMTGRPISNGKREEERDYGIFGIFGGHINCVYQNYVYMRAPRKDRMPYCYTLAGMHFTRNRIQEGKNPYTMELHDAFSFTKGYKVVKIGNMGNDFQTVQSEEGDLLFDLSKDSEQQTPIHSEEIEKSLCKRIVEKLKELDAPSEVFEYYRLNGES